MDRLITIFTEMPEKSFRTLVIVALMALLGLVGKITIDVAVIKSDTVWYHGVRK